MYTLGTGKEPSSHTIRIDVGILDGSSLALARSKQSPQSIRDMSLEQPPIGRIELGRVLGATLDAATTVRDEYLACSRDDMFAATACKKTSKMVSAMGTRKLLGWSSLDSVE